MSGSGGDEEIIEEVRLIGGEKEALDLSSVPIPMDKDGEEVVIAMTEDISVDQTETEMMETAEGESVSVQSPTLGEVTSPGHLSMQLPTIAPLDGVENELTAAVSDKTVCEESGLPTDDGQASLNTSTGATDVPVTDIAPLLLVNMPSKKPALQPPAKTAEAALEVMNRFRKIAPRIDKPATPPSMVRLESGNSQVIGGKVVPLQGPSKKLTMFAPTKDVTGIALTGEVPLSGKFTVERFGSIGKVERDSAMSTVGQHVSVGHADEVMTSLGDASQQRSLLDMRVQELQQKRSKKVPTMVSVKRLSKQGSGPPTPEQDILSRQRARRGKDKGLLVHACQWSDCNHQYEDVDDLFSHVLSTDLASGGHCTTDDLTCHWQGCSKPNDVQRNSVTDLQRHLRNVHLRFAAILLSHDDLSPNFFPVNPFKSPISRGGGKNFTSNISILQESSPGPDDPLFVSPVRLKDEEDSAEVIIEVDEEDGDQKVHYVVLPDAIGGQQDQLLMKKNTNKEISLTTAEDPHEIFVDVTSPSPRSPRVQDTILAEHSYCQPPDSNRSVGMDKESENGDAVLIENIPMEEIVPGVSVPSTRGVPPKKAHCSYCHVLKYQTQMKQHSLSLRLPGGKMRVLLFCTIRCRSSWQQKNNAQPAKHSVKHSKADSSSQLSPGNLEATITVASSKAEEALVETSGNNVCKVTNDVTESSDQEQPMEQYGEEEQEDEEEEVEVDDEEEEEDDDEVEEEAAGENSEQQNDLDNDEKRCEFCHRVGPSSTFYSSTKRFCTQCCCHRFSASHQRTRRSTPSRRTRKELARLSRSRSVGGGSSNATSPQSGNFAVPLTPTPASSKKFDWNTYLKSQNAVAVPAHCFIPRHFPDRNPFEVDMKVEMAIDLTQNPCNAYVMTVMRVIGMRLQLSYDGCPEGSPMAVRSVDSPDLFPLGWCGRQGGQLLAPPGALPKNVLQWNEFMQKNLRRAIRAGIDCFVRQPVLAPPEFQIGQKLELELLPKGPGESVQFCVATVADINETMVTVHLDGYDGEREYYHEVPRDSMMLHPVGYCQSRSLKLTPPKGVTDDVFDWDSYLHFTAAEAAPTELFTVSNNLFLPGMKLEAVDVRNPHMICVATVAEVEGDNVRIHFDGWSDKFDYSVPRTSQDIFPVGWCARYHHPLQPPAEKTPWNVNRNISGCPLAALNNPQGLNNNTSSFSPPTNSTNSNLGKVAKKRSHSADHLPAKKLRTSSGTFTSTSYVPLAGPPKVGSPRAVFNIDCEVGPHLNRKKIEQLPREICGSSVAVVLQSVLQHLVNCGKDQRFIFNQIRSGQSNSTVQCVAPSGERFIKHIQIADRNNILWSIVGNMLRKLMCCENFIQPRALAFRCGKCQGGVQGVVQGNDIAGPLRTYDASVSGTPQEQQLPSSESGAPSPDPPSTIAEDCNLPPVDVLNSDGWLDGRVVDTSMAGAGYPVGTTAGLPGMTRPRALSSTAFSPAVCKSKQEPVADLSSTTMSQGAQHLLAKNPSTWTVTDVADYFKATECVEHVSTLLSEEIDGKALLLLTPDTLVRYMDLRLGPSLKICSHIESLKNHTLQ